MKDKQLLWAKVVIICTLLIAAAYLASHDCGWWALGAVLLVGNIPHNE